MRLNLFDGLELWAVRQSEAYVTERVSEISGTRCLSAFRFFFLLSPSICLPVDLDPLSSDFATRRDAFVHFLSPAILYRARGHRVLLMLSVSRELR